MDNRFYFTCGNKECTHLTVLIQPYMTMDEFKDAFSYPCIGCRKPMAGGDVLMPSHKLVQKYLKAYGYCEPLPCYCDCHSNGNDDVCTAKCSEENNNGIS